jgi:hypothetical protein
VELTQHLMETSGKKDLRASLAGVVAELRCAEDAPPSCLEPPASFDPPERTTAEELCGLLGVASAVPIRTVGSGRDRKYSLVDVARLVSGKDPPNAAHDVRATLRTYSEGCDQVTHFKFPGQGQNRTPVADLRTTLLVVLRLRSRVAQRLSAKVIDVFVRYLGGDPELAREVLEELGATELPDGTLAFPDERVRRPPPVPKEAPSTTTVALELCSLLGVDQVVKIRTVGEGRERKFSLVDVARLVSGKEANNAWRDVAEVVNNFSEVAQYVSSFQFPGRGQNRTPVADLRTTLLVVLRLRSRVAQRLSAKVVDVFVRYLGGDPELAREVLEELGATELPDRTLAFPDERVRRPPPVPKEASTTTVALELCSLLGVDQVVKIRTVGSGRDRKYSLVDVARLVSGKDAQNAAHDVRATLQTDTVLCDDVSQFKFPGSSRYPTPVADLRTTLLVVLRLRSRVAQRLSAKVVDVFVRYLDGDPELAREVLALREIQEHLAVEQPQHPLREFGEAVEAELKEHEPPIVLELFDEAPLLLGAQHLYAMQCVERQGLWKVGVSADPHRRLEEVKTKNGKLNLVLRAVWRHEAGLEAAVLRALDVPPEDEELKELLKSTEFRWTHQDLYKGVKRAVDFARENAKIREFLSRTADVEEPDLKRRRVSLDLDERELCFQKEKLGMEKEKLGMEKEKLSIEKEKLSIEKEKLELEKTRWLFEQQKKAAQLGDVSC